MFCWHWEKSRGSPSSQERDLTLQHNRVKVSQNRRSALRSGRESLEMCIETSLIFTFCWTFWHENLKNLHWSSASEASSFDGNFRPSWTITWRRLWHVSLNQFTHDSCQGLRLWLSKATAVGTLRNWTCRELPRLLVFSGTTQSSRNPETQFADFGSQRPDSSHFCEMGVKNEWLDEFINIHQFRSQLLGYHLGTLSFSPTSWNQKWVCLKIGYPYTQWLMIRQSHITNGYFLGGIPHFQTYPNPGNPWKSNQFFSGSNPCERNSFQHKLNGKPLRHGVCQSRGDMLGRNLWSHVLILVGGFKHPSG
jgi:hypothetical protein